MSHSLKNTENKEDLEYQIYQLKEGDENHFIRFSSYKLLIQMGQKPDINNYNLVYTGKMGEGKTLESLYTQFNVAHPHDFTGHSLSVSDIILLKKANGEKEAYYVDSYGFMKLPSSFLEGKQPQQSNKKKPYTRGQER